MCLPTSVIFPVPAPRHLCTSSRSKWMLDVTGTKGTRDMVCTADVNRNYQHGEHEWHDTTADIAGTVGTTVTVGIVDKTGTANTVETVNNVNGVDTR